LTFSEVEELVKEGKIDDTFESLRKQVEYKNQNGDVCSAYYQNYIEDVAKEEVIHYTVDKTYSRFIFDCCWKFERRK